jgi:uracil-DNA glycosylase family 4
MSDKTELLIRLCREKDLKYVGTRGYTGGPICVTGEAPGKDEAHEGFPFVGVSGRYQNNWLEEAGINLKDVWFTNPYKTRPPENDVKRIEENGIPKEVYIEQFFEELEAFRPKFIVPVGATSLGILCPETIDRRTRTPTITKWRGSILTSTKLPWEHYIIPNDHPAYVLRNWNDRDLEVFVFRRLKEEYDWWKAHNKLQPLLERTLIVDPSPSEAEDYLHACLDTPGHVAVDLELLGYLIPFVIGLSYDPLHAISLEFYQEGGAWTTSRLVRIWRLIEEILKTKRILGQNYTAFDSNWLDAMGFPSGIDSCDDTLVRHHVLWPEMSHKLEFQTMQYTREPYYKDEGRGWHLGKKIEGLKRYNCKDVAVDLEIFRAQEEEFNDQPDKRKFYEEYEMPLARQFFHTDKRGILTDESIRLNLRVEVQDELIKLREAISQDIKLPVGLTKTECELVQKQSGILPVNLGSPIQLKGVITGLGIPLKKDRITGKESTDEEALNTAFAQTGHPFLKKLLRVRELDKLMGTYINAKVLRSVYYYGTSVTGTVGGRRSSKKSFLGYGGNIQNQPKHSELGERYRQIFISRPGRVLLSCDQIQAEDWIVQGIIADVSGDIRGISELRAGVDRHQRLASQVFNLPLEKCGKGTLERYLGKKTRHAANYDMQAQTMSEQMAKEGYHIPKDVCATILFKFHEVEPGIKKVFHKWVQQELITRRRLDSPLGRSRDFFGLHPTRDNHKIFREAYSYIPQTTVGDNTGMAALYVERHMPGIFLFDVHDAIVCEPELSVNAIYDAIQVINEAYHRTIKFVNGFELEIPVEYEIGLSLYGMAKCHANVSLDGLRHMLEELKRLQEVPLNIIGGQPSPLSAQL